MMDFGDDEDDMSALFVDYPMRLLCVNEKNDFSVFKTEIRKLFSAMRYRKDKKGLLQLINNNPDYQHVDGDTMEAMSVMLDIPQIWENREKYMDNEESEGGNMCQAIRELMEDARSEGMEQGIEQGIKSLIEFAQNMGMEKNITKEAIREKYDLTEEKAISYMEKYWK